MCLVYKMMEAMCTRITVRINDEEDESKSVNAVIPVMKTKAAEEMVLGNVLTLRTSLKPDGPYLP